MARTLRHLLANAVGDGEDDGRTAGHEARYGEGGEIPSAFTNYIKARQKYDYAYHGKVGNPSTNFVLDDVVHRFCVLGTVEYHMAKLELLKELGVDQFNIYLMHNATEMALDAYGEEIIPALEAQSAV